MKDKIFRYKKFIDAKIKTAAAGAIKVLVTDAQKIQMGEYNYVYKVLTSRGPVLARVFRRKYWPEAGKLQWIEKQLRKQHIPHAKILYYSRDSGYFPNGFMVTEFLEGGDGRTAVNAGRLSLAQAFVNIGRALKKVHRIKVRKFGLVNYGQGENSDFISQRVIKNLQQHSKDLLRIKIMQPEIYKIAQEVLVRDLSPFNRRFKPVLVHRDPARENAIYTPDKKWVLVDWDNAISSTWLEDYADLTFWADYKTSSAAAGRKKVLIEKNFFRGYGKTSFTKAEIKIIERSLHIIKCVQMLPYYYFTQKNMDGFRYIKNKLNRLLTENQ